MSVFKIPRKIIKMKLTEFVETCRNDLALTDFLQKVIDVKTAHYDERVKDEKHYLLRYECGKDLHVSATEIVNQILEQYEELDVVRENVLAVKSNYKIEARVNTLNQ